MKKTLLLTLLFLSPSLPVLAQSTFFFPQVADGTVANIQFQTTFIFVNTGGAGTVVIEFFDSSGTPIQLTLNSGGDTLGPASSFTINLASGESFSGQSPGTGAFQIGYARITAGDGVGGTAVFTRTDAASGVILYEAGVPAVQAVTSFSLFVDSEGNKDTGLAIVQPPDAPNPANLSITLRDKQFTQLATTPVPLTGGTHMAKFVSEFFANDPQTDNLEGTMTVISDQPVAAVTLRQNDDPAKEFPEEVPTLTTFPVISGVAQPASTGNFSVLSSGEVRVALDSTDEAETVIGVIYRIYSGSTLVQEMSRGISAPQVTHILPAATEGEEITRLETRIIYAGGQMSTAFDLFP